MALINLRNALMSGKRLPYDAEMEYLESTGTQYIDLGFSLTPSSDLYATVMLRGVVSNGAIFGQSNQFTWGANNPAYAIANSSAGKIFFAYGPTNKLYISDIGVGTLTDISYVGTTYTINGTTTTIPRVSSWSAAQGNAHVFCRGYANGMISPISKARVYSIKFVDNGATTHDLIPVRVGTVGYLYDRVSGKLFGNAGTGDFVLGPDVVPATWVDGEYWNTFGVATALSGASRCENFIPVQPSSSVTFYLGARPGGTTLYMVQYNANKERANSTYAGNGIARTVTIPANCYFVRVSAETAKKNEAYIHDNTNDRDLLRNGIVVVG